MTAILIKRVIEFPDFCGPATLSMLLSQYDIDVDQKKIAKSANALGRLARYGIRVDELALALKNIEPTLVLWAKQHATFIDLHTLVHKHKLAVGVEWQGEIAFEKYDEDLGHYSVVVGTDKKTQTMLVRDPEIKHRDRRFKYTTFERLWFDNNETGPNPPKEAKEWIHDNRVLFVVAQKDSEGLAKLGLKIVRPTSVAVQIARKSTSTKTKKKVRSTVKTVRVRTIKKSKKLISNVKKRKTNRVKSRSRSSRA